MTAGVRVQLVPTLTHGRVLVRPARAAASRGLLVGFHGYMESADLQLQRLDAVAGSSSWTIVSIQGLHRFYRGRSQDVVASWMTREDRDEAIADNLAYVAAALDEAPHDDATPIVFAGFSQGAAMAFRAGTIGRDRARTIVAVGGDVPPELLAMDAVRDFPPVLLARGDRDEWFGASTFDANVAALSARGVRVTPLVYDGAHEWNAAVAAAVAEFIEAIGRR